MKQTLRTKLSLYVCRALPPVCWGIFVILYAADNAGASVQLTTVLGLILFVVYGLFQFHILPYILMGDSYRVLTTRFGGAIGVQPLWYLPFVVFTAGIGPVVWYWMKIDSLLSSMVEQQIDVEVEKSSISPARKKALTNGAVVLAVLIVVSLVVSYFSMFEVSHREDVVIVRGGEIAKVVPPGIGLSIPGFDTVYRYPTRQFNRLDLDLGDQSLQNVSVQWRIMDLKKAHGFHFEEYEGESGIIKTTLEKSIVEAIQSAFNSANQGTLDSSQILALTRKQANFVILDKGLEIEVLQPRPAPK